MFSFTIKSIGIPFQELQKLPLQMTLAEEGWKLVDLVLSHHPEKGMILEGIMLQKNNDQTFVPLDKISVKQDCISIHMDVVVNELPPEDTILFSEVKDTKIYTKDGKSLSEIEDAIIQADVTIDFKLKHSKSIIERIFQRKGKDHGSIILNTRYLESITGSMGMLSYDFKDLRTDIASMEDASTDAQMREYRDKALRFVEKIEPITTRKNM